MNKTLPNCSFFHDFIVFEFTKCYRGHLMVKVIVCNPVSIKHGLRTTDYGLRTTDYGLRTTDYGLGIKHGLGIKRGLRITDWV